MIEDNKADQRLIEMYLSYVREIYFSIVMASNLSEARKHMKDNQFDVALVDYYLPDGKGIEFAKKVGPETDMPFVMLSNYNPQEDQGEMIQVGIYDFIPKLKMNPMLLEKVLKLAIRRSRNLKRSRVLPFCDKRRSLS